MHVQFVLQMLHLAHQGVDVGFRHAHVVGHLVVINDGLLQGAQAFCHRFEYRVRGVQFRFLRHENHAGVGCSPNVAFIQFDGAGYGF